MIRMEPQSTEDGWPVRLGALAAALPGLSAQCDFTFPADSPGYPRVRPPAEPPLVDAAKVAVAAATAGGCLGEGLQHALAHWDGVDLTVMGGLHVLGAVGIAAQAAGEYPPMLAQTAAATQALVAKHRAAGTAPAWVRRVVASQGGAVPRHFVVAVCGDSMGLVTMDVADHRVHWTSLHEGVFGAGVQWPTYADFAADVVEAIVAGLWTPGGDSMATLLAEGRTSRSEQ